MVKLSCRQFALIKRWMCVMRLWKESMGASLFGLSAKLIKLFINQGWESNQFHGQSISTSHLLQWRFFKIYFKIYIFKIYILKQFSRTVKSCLCAYWFILTGDLPYHVTGIELLTNCLSVFDHFVGLALKGLRKFCSCFCTSSKMLLRSLRFSKHWKLPWFC